MNKIESPISICIPRIAIEQTKEYIIEKFKQLDIGQIVSIKEIPLRNDNKHKRIIILILLNEDNPQSMDLHSRLKKNETIKLVYEMPWYWKIVSTSPQK
jgi:hypothetical protein|uniref:Uncharacterized protein n=1 Tax=viral metagenome TaxID=1070528 RepID=A0A6C0LS79_9ZZZZ